MSSFYPFQKPSSCSGNAGASVGRGRNVFHIQIPSRPVERSRSRVAPLLTRQTQRNSEAVLAVESLAPDNDGIRRRQHQGDRRKRTTNCDEIELDLETERERKTKWLTYFGVDGRGEEMPDIPQLSNGDLICYVAACMSFSFEFLTSP